MMSVWCDLHNNGAKPWTSATVERLSGSALHGYDECELSIEGMSNPHGYINQTIRVFDATALVWEGYVNSVVHETETYSETVTMNGIVNRTVVDRLKEDVVAGYRYEGGKEEEDLPSIAKYGLRADARQATKEGKTEEGLQPYTVTEIAYQWRDKPVSKVYGRGFMHRMAGVLVQGTSGLFDLSVEPATMEDHSNYGSAEVDNEQDSYLRESFGVVEATAYGTLAHTKNVPMMVRRVHFKLKKGTPVLEELSLTVGMNKNGSWSPLETATASIPNDGSAGMTVLAASVSDTATVFPVISHAGFTDSGELLIGGAVLKYASKTLSWDFGGANPIHVLNLDARPPNGVAYPVDTPVVQAQKFLWISFEFLEFCLIPNVPVEYRLIRTGGVNPADEIFIGKNGGVRMIRMDLEEV